MKDAYAQTRAEFVIADGEAFRLRRGCRKPAVERELRRPDVGSPSPQLSRGPIVIGSGAQLAAHLFDNTLITMSNRSDEDMIGYEAGFAAVL